MFQAHPDKLPTHLSGLKGSHLLSTTIIHCLGVLLSLKQQTEEGEKKSHAIKKASSVLFSMAYAHPYSIDIAKL